MNSKLFLNLLRANLLGWTIISLFVVADCFSPGDVSSIAAAVAAAHIGKPPPFHSPSLRDTTKIKDAPNGSFNDSIMHQKFDVIGKAPTSKVKSNQVTNGITPTVCDQIHRCDQNNIKVDKIPEEASEFSCNSFLEGPSSPIIETNNLVDIDHVHDFERILSEKRLELDNFFSENASTEKIQANNKNMNCDSDEDDIDDIPTVHAVFCGYKATLDELSRLRSAHVI